MYCKLNPNKPCPHTLNQLVHPLPCVFLTVHILLAHHFHQPTLYPISTSPPLTLVNSFISTSLLFTSPPFTLWVVLGRYTPIDNRTRYWAKKFLDEVWEFELRKFSEKKKEKKNIVRIRNHAHSFDGPMQLPLAHRDTAAKFCFNHSFIEQLFLAFPVS